MKHVGEEEPHYGLRKLSIGVASVLLGISLYSVIGHADSVSNRENFNVNQNVNEGNLNENDQVVLQGKQAVSSTSSDENVVESGTGDDNTANSSQNTLRASSEQAAKVTPRPQNNFNDATIFNNKVQTNSDNSGSIFNYQASLYDGTGSDTYNWKPNNDSHSYSLDLSFDLDSRSLVAGSVYNLGRVRTDYVYNSRSLSLWCNFSDVPAIINGTQYGYLSFENFNDLHNQFDLNFHVIKTADASFSGLQHFSFHLKDWFSFGYSASPLLFKTDDKQVKVNLFFSDYGGEVISTHHINILKPDLTYDNETFSWNDNWFGYTNASTTNFCNDISLRLGSNDKLNDVSVGKSSQLNENIPKILEIGGKLTLSHGSLLLNRSNVFVAKDIYIPVYHSDGRKSGETLDGGYQWAARANMNAHASVDLGNNLSLDEMKGKNFVGFGYSRQNDGTYYYLIKQPSSELNITDDDIHFALQNSWQVVADPDPQKAMQVSLDKFHQGIQMYLLETVLPVSDSTTNTVISATRLYNNFMDLHDTNQTSANTLWAQQAIVNGQSTVKFHLINSTNGAELSQVQSFTDWPNRGKKVNLQISVPAGYQLVTANTSDILKRLNLTGTAITANTQVDYPKENTISDYYVLLAPETEVATINIVDENENNKVLYSGQVSGLFNSVIAGNDGINGQLKNLLDSGLYDLDHNGLNDGGLYKDGTNTVTISLKHHIDSTERHYRVIEDLPDGTKKVIIELKAKLYKDADSNYWVDPAYIDGNDQKSKIQSNTYELLVGQRADDGLPNYLKADVDQFIGYTRSMPDSITDYLRGIYAGFYNSTDNVVYFDLFNGYVGVTDLLPSQDFHIIYTKNNYPVTISYYDTTGKQIATSTTTHTYQDVITSNDSLPAGYVLLAGQTNQLTVGVDHNELDLLVAPIIQRSQETKQVTRTIIYDDPNIKPVVQVVTLYHDKFTNIVDHSVSYGQWIVDGPSEFAAYVPIFKSGYVADPIAAEQVNGDSKDETVSVHYQAINGRKDYKYIDVNGVGYDSLPVGFEIVNGQDTSKNGILIVKKPAPVVTNKIEYVTRTITIIMPNGKHRTIIQKARKGSKFLKPHLPKLLGYKVDVNGSLDAMTANSDVNVMVKFVKM